MQKLKAAGALSNTAVFTAGVGADSGTKLATLFAAAAAGERVRDEGSHALVRLSGGALQLPHGARPARQCM